MKPPPHSCLLGLAFLFAVTVAPAAEPSPEQAAFFESKIRPILANRCWSCHGPEKQKSGLRLDSLAAVLTGGDSGPAVEPGRADGSLLLDAVLYKSLQMPPDRKLPAEEVAALTEWVKQGAPWPGSTAAALAPRKPGLQVTDEDRRFWSFQPVRRPPVPDVSQPDWCRNPIDRFILAQLEAAGLSPSPEATPRELLRRAAFDLTGLPPSAEQIEQFAAATHDDTFERAIDRLLDDPAFGERWGRHWLDLVRYAQTNGYERDDEKPHAWRYRDFVIDAFNADKPYRTFILEQLAGDELDDASDDSRIATGFYRLGVWDDEPDDSKQAEFDEFDDMVSTTGSVFLGLTIGCARCHDHKFDPIPQEDYYSLLAFLRNVKRYAKPDKDSVGVIFTNLARGGQALTIHETAAEPPVTQVLLRGSVATPGKQVEPRFPQVLSPSEADGVPTLPGRAADGQSSGRRRVLAEWIARDTHPLTARVIVNRLWQQHFGRGLVPTPSDFGQTGLPPSHPELLDWLASELVTHDWSLKHIHRLILTSAAWRQSSHHPQPRAVDVDPDNKLLWRQNLRRLEAEIIRDAVLTASGSLNRELGGRGVFPTLPPEVLATQSRPGAGWDKSPPDQQHRRSVYVFVKRTLGVPLLESFDAASPDTSTATRNTTTIAPQALILLNSSFMDEQAAAFAASLTAATDADLVTAAFRRALGRSPSDPERSTLIDYLARQRLALPGNEPAARAALCKVLLNLNEFVYVD